jgi:hypothetical protein
MLYQYQSELKSPGSKCHFETVNDYCLSAYHT